MFLRECKRTIATQLSMLIYKHLALRFSRKTFFKKSKMCQRLKTDTSAVLTVALMAYADRSILKRRGYETAFGFEQSGGMAAYVPVLHGI